MSQGANEAAPAWCRGKVFKLKSTNTWTSISAIEVLSEEQEYLCFLWTTLSLKDICNLRLFLHNSQAIYWSDRKQWKLKTINIAKWKWKIWFVDIYYIENLLLLSYTFDVLLWFGALTGWGFPEWQTWHRGYYPYRAMWSGGSTENQYLTQYHNISGDVFLWLKAYAFIFWLLKCHCFSLSGYVGNKSATFPLQLLDFEARTETSLRRNWSNTLYTFDVVNTYLSCTSFYSRWMQSTLFSFQITLVTQKASVARLRPEILTIKPFLISKKNQTKTIK